MKRNVYAILVLTLILTGCIEAEVEVTLDDRIEALETQLLDEGASQTVVECVTRLASYDLRSGDIDSVELDELVLNCERADEILNGGADDEGGESLAFADGPYTLGDDPTLDRLWTSCADGSGAACNDLFEQSPVGSDYEQFGVSCGNRDDVLDCAELDGEDGEDGDE